MKRSHFYQRLTTLVLTGLFLAGSQAAFAADTVELNLDDSVQMALENNRTIKQSLADVDKAKWAISQSRRQFGPKLTWQTTANRIGGEAYESARMSGQNYKFNYGNSVSVGIPLYNEPLRSQVESEKLALNSADLTLENTKQNIRLQATTDYYKILQARNLIQVEQESVNTLQEHLDNVNAQYGVGTVAKSDVLASQVSLANAQQSLVTAQNNYDVAVSTLNNVIGLPTDTVLSIHDQLKYTKYDLTLDDCTRYALANRADGAAAVYAIKQAEQAVKTAKAGNAPTVNAAAARSIAGEQPFNDNHTSSNTWSVGATASWDFFDNGVTAANQHAAEAAVTKAKEASAQTDDAIRLDVRTAFLNLQAAEKNIHTTEVAVNQAEEDYKIAQVRYSAGVGTNLDVMDAEEKLTTARTNYYTALYNYNTSKASLDQAMGIPVDLDVTKYVAAQESGKTAVEAREAARINGNAVFETPAEQKETAKKPAKQKKEKKQKVQKVQKAQKAQTQAKAQPKAQKQSAAPAKPENAHAESQAVAAELAK